MKTKHTACYLRVSSEGQKNDSQRAEIKRWLKGQNIRAANVAWFEDKETGKTINRPELKRMQAAIFKGEVKTVVVWKLDRLSRVPRDGINVLADWCERGVRVISVTQQIDLSGAVGRMIASLLFGLAEIELEYRSERQAAGIRVAKAAGVYKGRKAGTTKAKPARARDLAAQGFTRPEIANAMGVGLRTVYRYLGA